MVNCSKVTTPAALAMLIIMSSAVYLNPISSQSNSGVSWYLSFNGRFTELNFKTGRLYGTYNILLQKTALTPEANTRPSAYFLSKFGSYHDLGPGFTAANFDTNLTRYYTVLEQGAQDEINLTSVQAPYPLDYYVAGFVLILNETAAITGSDFSFNVQLSRNQDLLEYFL